MLKEHLKKGFTLVELMVVIAIIGILASIGIPRFSKFIIDAKATEAIRNISRIAEVTQAYKDVNRVYPNEGEEILEKGSKSFAVYMPQLDLSESTNFSYFLTTDKEKGICIMAKSISWGNDRCIYFLSNPSSAGIRPEQIVYFDDDHFYKKYFIDENASVFFIPDFCPICIRNINE